ncbi:MAG: hypothetical protein J6S14_05055 [Clostridia bacterium]|nr:hypothetical protein [Clostridia bacterium]
MSFISDYENARKKLQANRLKNISKKGNTPIVAPTAEELTKQEKKDGGWFKSGAFDDGYDFGDITKSLVSTVGDFGINAAKGVVGMVEGITDLAMYGMGALEEAGAIRSGASIVGSGSIKDAAKWNMTEDIFSGVEEATNKNSFFDDKMDSVSQGIGQVAAIIATGGIAGAAGATAAGASAITTGVMGASSMGSGMSEAYQSGATDKEAVTYGVISGVVDAGTEMLFGGLGKTVKAVGLSKGVSSLDDVFAKKLSSKISNQTAKTLTEFGVKASAEGFEEVLAGVGSAVGKKLTYMSEEKLSQLIKDERLLDQFVVGAVTSGVMQSGIVPKTKSGSLRESIETGRDFIDGFTANEQKVLDSVYNERVAEAEKDGKKLTKKEKNEIYDQVQKELKKGYISTDTIESVLGGDTYKTYRDTVSSEDALINEYEELRKMKKGEMNDIQQDRLAELKAMNLTDTTKRDSLKEQLRKEVYGQLTRDVKGKTQTDNYLLESYNEQARRGKAFEADVSKYSDEQAAVVQKAIDSGILNNTKRTHEFVDMIAKISADKGVPFDFANNEKIKESGFALDGRAVNGYVTKDGITLNVNSSKTLNTVVGHEITHVLEGTELYGALQTAAIEYAKAKGEYDSRYKALESLYKNVEGTDIDAELTADLIGDYLFTDEDFIRKLSAEHRNVFQKIYDEIKYLCKIATAGSKEARQLEKVKRVFDKVYRENVKAKENTAEGGVKYSLCAFDDGQRFVNIETDQKLFDGLSVKEQTDLATKIIKERFQGKVIGIENKAFVNGNTVDEFTHPAKHLEPDIYEAKMRASTELDNLMDAGFGFRNEADGKYGHTHLDAVGGFDYFDVIFKVGTEYYQGVINIKNINRGKLLKDITKIRNITQDMTSRYGDNPSYAFLRDASMNSISQNSEKSTENQKNSLSAENADIAPIGNYNVSGENVEAKYSLDKYTEKQYNDFGWARDAEAITKNELDDLYSKIQEKGSLKRFPRSSTGEAIIEVNDDPHKMLGVDNVFVFVTGTKNNPQISKVARFQVETDTEMEIIKENLYERGSFSNPYYSFLIEEGLAREYSKKSAFDYNEYAQKARRGSGGTESDRAYGDRGIEQNGNGAFEQTQSNEIAPIKEASKDGSFFDGNAKQSLSAIDEAPKHYGNYNVFGKDIALEAPIQEDISKTEQNVYKAEQVADFAPMAEDLEPAAQDIGPVAEDAKTGQMSESFDDQNAIRYNLDGYSQHQKDNWKNSKRIVLCEGIEHFRQFVRNALSGNTQTNKKMYFGTISSKLAEDIENATGANVKGYNLSLAEGEIRKISKSHGDEKTEAQRGQRAITEDDYLNIPQIVQSPDSITLSPKLYEGKPVVEFRKTNGNETSTVAAVVSDKRLDLFVQTTFINKKSGDIATPKSVQADSFTPKATGGTAPVDTSNVSTDSISQNAPNVNINSQNSSDIQDIGPVGESEAKKSDGVQRKWVGTATDSQAVDGKILPDDLNQELMHYQPISNKKTLGKANTRLDSMGYDASITYFNSQFANKRTTVEDIVLGERLIQEAIKRGDTQTAGKLIEDVAILGTELGQKVQALSIIKRLTPEGQLRMLQRTVERGKTKGDKAFEGVEITQEMIDHILKTYGKDGTFDQAELNKAVEDVKQQIADKMKVTNLEKVNAWRYLSMLGNPKTHIRNLVSNVAMRGTLAAKNAVARTIETFAPVENRTKTWKRASEDVKSFSKNTAVEMKDTLSDGGKYSEEAGIKAKRATFKNKVLNGVYNLNNDLLSKEDWWFSKPVFEKSLSEYLTANGINTAADIANNPEVVEKAKQYAIEQSQIATFRQYSWLANKISEMEKHNTATNIALGAVLPFKRTPINIAKTALNYSPLGFTKTLTYDISQVKNGKMEASTLVDHLSQNLTGTALTLVGYLLASAGFINGAGGDDKEGKYDYQLGEQAYSINIGDSTFSLSWLSPVAMPLFVGANAYEQLVEGKEWNGDVVVETLAQTLDPLSEMSFLSSLDDVLSSYDSGIEKFAGIGQSMAQNYVSQFVPTLSSQVAAVMDDTKRTTKVAGDSDFKFIDETINNLKYKIPGLRNTLEPSIDIWGNEIKQTENIMGRAFESFLAPYSRKENIASEVDAELKTLYSETGDDGLIPSIPYNYVNYKNEKYEMSAEDYTAYKKTYGQTAYELLEELFNTDTYQYASAEERADMVNKVYDYARDEAKRELLTKYGIEYTNATLDGEEYYKENSIYGAIENDMTADEYEIYRQSPEKSAVVKAIGGYKAYKTYSSELYDIKADKDENGDTISGSRKKKVIEYINGLDADYGEKIILFKSEYKSDNTYNRDILEYLNSREDISYEEMVAILTELGFKIGSDGKTVTW